MAKAKISQLNPKGSNLSSTDLFEVSVQTGSGYDTYSITGQEIVGTISSGFVPYTGATQDVDLDANKLSAESIYIEGTNGNGHLHLKHQNSDATATGQSTALWANSDGDIKWKNDNDYKTTLKTSLNTADRVYTFPDANCTLQAQLVSGTNIKTIEGQSILGSGNIDITKSDVGLGNVDNTSDLNKPISTATQTALNAKQDTLVSGTNIKTINSTSLVGSGNVAVQDTLVSGTNIKTVNSTSLLGSGDVAVQATLVSGTNIKTVNSTSLLGSGDVAVQSTLVSGTNIKTVNSTSLLGSGDITTPVGIHAPLIPASGGFINPLMVTYQATAQTIYSANLLRCFPFIPMRSVTIVSYSINVTIAVASSNMRVLFYDNLNGLPNAKLHESANIDTSTIGIKTVTQAYTFNAGTIYWLCVQTSAAIAMTSHSPSGGYAWQQVGASFNLSNSVNYTYALGAAPATLTTTGATYNTNNLPHLIFNL